MSEKTDKETARMDLYMSAIVAARVTGWRGQGSEDSVGPEGIKWSFGLCMESASDDNELEEAAFLASKAIEAVDANVEFNKKCATNDRIDESRERRGEGPLWEDGPEL